jgi:hypothetical protein
MPVAQNKPAGVLQHQTWSQLSTFSYQLCTAKCRLSAIKMYFNWLQWHASLIGNTPSCHDTSHKKISEARTGTPSDVCPPLKWFGATQPCKNLPLGMLGLVKTDL